MDSDRYPFCWFEHISLRPIYACTLYSQLLHVHTRLDAENVYRYP